MSQTPEGLLLDTAQKKLDSQQEVIAQLDQKSSVILGFSVVSVVEIAGFLLLVAGEGGQMASPQPWQVHLIFYFALICTVLGSALGLIALRGNASHCFHASEFEQLRVESRDEQKFFAAILSYIQGALDRNYRVIRHKRTYLHWSMIATGAAVLVYTSLVASIFHSKF